LDAPDRRRAVLAIPRRPLVGRERTSAELTYRFETQPGVYEWIRDLSRREAACCPFFVYTISTTDSGEITWLIATDGDPVAESILDEMYRLPDIITDGFPGLLRQLDTIGLTVATSDDGQVTSVS
jgi:hypothetical protein